MKLTIRRLSRRMPYELRRRDQSRGGAKYPADALIERMARHTMIPYAGLAMLCDQVEYLDREGISGAIVQCGVWHGGSAALMAGVNARHSDAPRRTLHLFDSFAGIPEPEAAVDGNRAVSVVGGVGKARGRLQVAWDYEDRGGPGSERQVRGLLDEVGFPQYLARFHVGWFQETVAAAVPEIGAIALLHLDGDWYESTKVCLGALYGQVVTGGFVVIDDYGTYEGCRLAVDESLAQESMAPFLSRVTPDMYYLIKSPTVGRGDLSP